MNQGDKKTLKQSKIATRVVQKKDSHKEQLRPVVTVTNIEFDAAFCDAVNRGLLRSPTTCPRQPLSPSRRLQALSKSPVPRREKSFPTPVPAAPQPSPEVPKVPDDWPKNECDRPIPADALIALGMANMADPRTTPSASFPYHRSGGGRLSIVSNEAKTIKRETQHR